MTQIGNSSMLAMLETGLLSMIIPVGLIVTWKIKNKKTGKVSIVPFIGGILAYMFFGFVLKTLFDALVLSFDTPVSRIIASNAFIAAVYFAVITAIFETGGKYFVLKKVFKDSLNKYKSVKDAVSFGIGFGMLEIVLTLGVAYVRNYMYAVLINNGTLEQMIADYEKAGDASSVKDLQSIANELTTITPIDCMLYSVDRVALLLIQVALSVAVFYSIYKKKKKLFTLTFVIHAFSGMIFYFSTSASSIGANCVIEICALIATVVVVYLAYVLYQILLKEESAKELAGVDSSDENSGTDSSNGTNSQKSKKTSKSISKIANGRYTDD
ncbi:MAG: YhfC family intramembrane metalloprotease [Lachnospiraceae bacterium]|nr:YhfC family intramembrane metalloprotease [Lachnospiraceae bacterium]